MHVCFRYLYRTAAVQRVHELHIITAPDDRRGARTLHRAHTAAQFTVHTLVLIRIHTDSHFRGQSEWDGKEGEREERGREGMVALLIPLLWMWWMYSTLPILWTALSMDPTLCGQVGQGRAGMLTRSLFEGSAEGSYSDAQRSDLTLAMTGHDDWSASGDPVLALTCMPCTHICLHGCRFIYISHCLIILY